MEILLTGVHNYISYDKKCRKRFVKDQDDLLLVIIPLFLWPASLIMLSDIATRNCTQITIVVSRVNVYKEDSK